MIKKTVKKVTVEYRDGETETFEEDGMFHIARHDFPRGATKPEQHFTSHDIRWIDPRSPFSNQAAGGTNGAEETSN